MKIYHGVVADWVDGKRRVPGLDHYEYSGPKSLIKKDSRFRAVAEQ